MKRYIADELGLPPTQVMWFLIPLFAAILIGGIWLYQDSAYPHGPMTYMGGQVEELCENYRRCEEVWVEDYREDKSNLNNPGWVTVFRNIDFLFFILTVGLGIVALSNGMKLVKHFRIREELLVLDDKLRGLLLLSEPSFDLLYTIFKTNVDLRRWGASKDFLHRARKLEIDWSGELLDNGQEYLQTRSNSYKESDWPDKWELESLQKEYNLRRLESIPTLTASKYEKIAQEALSQAKFYLAIDNYDEAIKLEPDNSYYYYLRGEAYYYLDSYELAIEDLTEAIRIDPQYAEAYAKRSDVYYHLNQNEQAIEDLTVAIQIDPSYYSARDQLYKLLGEDEL